MREDHALDEAWCKECFSEDTTNLSDPIQMLGRS